MSKLLSNVVPEMNHVLGSKVDVVKVGSHQQEQLNLLKLCESCDHEVRIIWYQRA